MTPQSLIEATAARHGLSYETLAAAVAAWDLVGLIGADADLAGRVVDGHAESLAKIAATKADRAAKIEAHRTVGQTPAAKADPAASCTRCDGKGRIRGFNHIEGGKCFACGGAGVRRLRVA
mgnify:CR=1 FL=1|tara:strand:- start:1736 stop:2098 length:363 start_codon:yes stop_codon:yes gene_type:complete